MLTSKQRAFLRGMANGMDAIFQVGKNGVTPELRDTVYNAGGKRAGKNQCSG